MQHATGDHRPRAVADVERTAVPQGQDVVQTPGVPQCVHEAVKTMIFLAPLEESRALHAIAEAVPPAGPRTHHKLLAVGAIL